MSEKYIGIDVGGTSARVGRFDSIESPEIEKQESFQISGDYERDVGEIARLIREVLEGDTAAKIGFSVAGHIDHDSGRLLTAPNAKGWKGQALREDLAKAAGAEVELVNDAQAAALAEARFGEHGSKDFWFIIWGTGVGGSVVEFRDVTLHVVDAEPGHQILDWSSDAPECGCGRHGCLEAFTGGAAVEKRFGVPAAELSEEQWSDVCEWLARGFYNLIRIHPTEWIVVGGGVAMKQSARLPVIQERANELLRGFRTIQIDVASHGENAGLIGALAALRRN